MNFLKRLFKSNDQKKYSDFSRNIESNNINKVVEQITPQVRLLDKNELSEKEKIELIERFAREDNYISKKNAERFDPLLEDAARLIVQNQMGSTSLVQRRMKLGYNQAGRLMEQLEEVGIVGPNLGAKARDVLIKTEAELEQFIQDGFKFYKTDLQLFYQENKAEIENKRRELQEQKRQQQIQSEKNLIKQELLEKERKKQLQREVFKELLDEGAISNQSTGKEWNREPIPQDIMDRVWNRDGGRCVKCGGQEHLEFDHIIPFSKGGANTYRNLQVLCKKCNIEKSNKIG